MGVVKHFRSCQNSKFAKSLQYLEKDLRDEDDFLQADKHQSFLQVDFNALGIKFATRDTVIIDEHDNFFYIKILITMYKQTIYSQQKLIKII